MSDLGLRSTGRHDDPAFLEREGRKPEEELTWSIPLVN